MNTASASFGWASGVATVLSFDMVVWMALAAAGGGLVVWLVGEARRRREQAQAEKRFGQLSTLIEHTDCVLWESQVTLRNGGWQWTTKVYPSALTRKIFGEYRFKPEVGLWSEFEIPTKEEMDRRARMAIEQGQAGYEQEFSATRNGRTLWIHEQVSITPLGAGRYWLVGLAIDRTKQHDAEGAREQSEQRISHILSHAQCTIWQATVVERDGVLHWPHFDMPRSLLSDQLFDSDWVFDPRKGFWDTLNVPDLPAMNERSSRAIRQGEPGYTQQFKVINRHGREFWLHERVSITLVQPGEWRLVGVVTDITVQIETQRALQRTEQRLAQLLERADSTIWQARVELKPDGRLDWTMFIPRSQLYRRVFGVDPEMQAGLMWKERGVVEHAEMEQRARDAILGGAPGYEQVFHATGQGEDIWLSESVTITRTGPGTWDLVGVITDITKQRQSESARQASEQRLSELMTRAECLLWEGIADLTGPTWQWQFKIQPSLLCRKLYGEFNPPADTGLWRSFDIPERAEMDARCRAAMEEGRAGYDQIFHIRRPNMPPIWIRENVTIRALGNNRYSLVGVALDITPLRIAEEALAAEKERLAVTLRAMHEAVITTDTTGLVQFMNSSAEDMLECRGVDCIGRPVQAICRLQDGRSEQPVELPVVRVARGDTVVDLPPHTRLVGRDSAQLRIVEGCCAPIHAMDSRVIGTVLVLRDVTAQHQLEQELIRATRLESVGLLAGGIAHDFNNILTAVIGNLTLAQLDTPPDSRAHTSLLAAEKAALRARDLTQQLLTFAKGGEPIRAAVQLETVVREVTDFALHGSKVKAHYDIAPDLWPADVDKGQIGRVVQNLVINAVQAMPHGGTLQLSVRNDSQDGAELPGLAAGDYLRITITDTGLGIRPEDLPRIFDPYFTTKQSGTGLGLAAVYSIVKKHRGHIDVESAVGRGTTFRLWLPALRQGAERNATQVPWSGVQRLRGRVLLMDDEEIIRSMASSLLGRYGLEVDCAEDGAVAVAKYREALSAGRRYDLVIMDLTVPGGMGGLEAMTKLREIDPGVKAVVSSGYSSDPVLANHHEHGFAAVVAKPYEVAELARVLATLLPPAG